jgi:di/tripeptidase
MLDMTMINNLPHQDKSDDELRRIIVGQGKLLAKKMKQMREMDIRIEDLADENNTCRLQLKAPEKSIIWYRIQPEDNEW